MPMLTNKAAEPVLHPVVKQAVELFYSCQYSAFFDLFDREHKALTGEDLGELYYIRALIKTFYFDFGAQEDLRLAAQLLPEGNRLPSMYSHCDCMDSPILFTYYNAQSSSLSACRNALVRSPLTCRKNSNPESYILSRLFDAECCYYVGNTPKAVRIASSLYEEAKNSGWHYYMYIGAFVLIRSYVEQGDGKAVRRLLLEIKSYTRSCEAAGAENCFTTIEGWINMVTGWMGKLPRFYDYPGHGDIFSLDVHAYYNTGKAYDVPPDKKTLALIEAADRVKTDGQSVHHLNLAIYEALLLYKYISPKRAADRLYEAYRYTVGNRVSMPYVEYGARIIPLIKYIRASGDERFADIWLDKIQRLASQYEKTLEELIVGDQEKDLGLTSKEKDVLSLLAKGMKNTEISNHMGISPSTTKDYTRKIYRKMDVKSRTEAVLVAQSMKIV